MDKGFVYWEHQFAPMFGVTLNGHQLTPKELCGIAEQMRVQLLEFGVVVQVKNKEKDCDN